MSAVDKRSLGTRESLFGVGFHVSMEPTSMSSKLRHVERCLLCFAAVQCLILFLSPLVLAFVQ